jgi:hypothetical protein
MAKRSKSNKHAPRFGNNKRGPGRRHKQVSGVKRLARG